MNDAVAGKGVKVVRFLSLLFVALTLGPSLAHLFELPNKINLSKTSITAGRSWVLSCSAHSFQLCCPRFGCAIAASLSL